MRVIVIIPARLHSTRLPQKVILDICGKPMLQHVYEAALQAKEIDAVYIATDSEEVRKVCVQFTEHILMTSDTHLSGTDRLAEASASIPCDAVINIQGDEPLIDPALIDTLAKTLKTGAVPICSVMHRIRSFSELHSPHAVKVVTDHVSNALYFSRAVIPYSRDESMHSDDETLLPDTMRYFKHIGVYGYTKTFLQTFASLPQSALERSEKLEQLRVLENGYPIKMIETDYEPVGVDTPSDLERVRALFTDKEQPERGQHETE